MAPVAQLDRVLPSEADQDLSNDTVFVAVAEFLSSQSDLIRFVSDRFALQNALQKNPAEAGLFIRKRGA